MRVPVESFERMYQANPDPWAFGSAPSEQRRYRLIAAALPERRYAFAFEPGCSTGELTARLAETADRVLAIDASTSAVVAARRRFAQRPHVIVAVGALPDDWPEEVPDLIVLSEVLYYLTLATAQAVVAEAKERLAPGGTLLASHWIGRSRDHLLTGEVVQHLVREVIGTPPDLDLRTDMFHLASWDALP